MQQACRRLATLVGSSQVLYTHESLPYEGDDVQAIARWLTTNIGPPAANRADLHAAEHFGPQAWFVEAVAADAS